MITPNPGPNTGPNPSPKSNPVQALAAAIRNHQTFMDAAKQDIQRLQQRVRELENSNAELRAGAQRLNRVMHERMEAVRNAAHRATRTSGAGATGQRTGHQAGTDEPTARAQQHDDWAQLVAWVGWLVDHYGLHSDIAACWHRHPALTAELHALHTAHFGAHEEGAAATAALRWHEALDRARERWRGWDAETKCRLNRKHTDPYTDPWPDDWQVDAGLPRPTDKPQQQPSSTEGGQR